MKRLSIIMTAAWLPLFLLWFSSTVTFAYDIGDSNNCILSPQYNVVLQEQPEGGFMLQVVVDDMGRAERLEVDFSYTDYLVSVEITETGTYLIGNVGLDDGMGRTFYAEDNVLFVVTESSSLCGNNLLLDSYEVLPSSSKYEDDACTLALVASNISGENCHYQEDRYLRAGISSGEPTACGMASPTSDLWLRIPVANGGTTEIALKDPGTDAAMPLNYELFKGQSCSSKSLVQSCQLGSNIVIGPYEVGEWLYVRLWPTNASSDQAVRICLTQTSCILPDYSITTTKDCTNDRIQKSVIIDNMGAGTAYDIYMNNQLVHANVGMGKHDLPVFAPCTDAVLKLQATNVFCGITEELGERCPKPSGCANATTLLEQSTTNLNYTTATTCGDDYEVARCGVDFFGGVAVQWLQFEARSTDPDIWLDPNFPAAVNVLEGNCNDLRLIACYQQSTTSLQVDPRELSLVIGQTYYIAIYNLAFDRLDGTAANFDIALQSDEASLAVQEAQLSVQMEKQSAVLHWRLTPPTPQSVALEYRTATSD
ncbi:MAG: hypothetical protein AAGK47_09840, partial [Bacteroidota bacterium]